MRIQSEWYPRLISLKRRMRRRVIGLRGAPENERASRSAPQTSSAATQNQPNHGKAAAFPRSMWRDGTFRLAAKNQRAVGKVMWSASPAAASPPSRMPMIPRARMVYLNWIRGSIIATARSETMLPMSIRNDAMVSVPMITGTSRASTD